MWPSLTAMRLSSPILPMSTSVSGTARRSFIKGISEWPPARNFASSPASAAMSRASSTEEARRYVKGAGINSASSRRPRPEPHRSGTRNSPGPLLAGRGQNCADNIVVAGAPAQVPLEGGSDLVLGGRRILVEQGHARHDHARGAEPALQPVLGAECPLHRVQLP